MTMDIVHFLEDEAEAFRRSGPRAGRAANRPRALGPCARKRTPRPVAPGADGGSGGVGDPSTPLEAYRGTTLCLRARSIGAGARLTVREGFEANPASRPTVPLQMAARVVGVSRPRVQTLGRPLPMRGRSPKQLGAGDRRPARSYRAGAPCAAPAT